MTHSYQQLTLPGVDGEPQRKWRDRLFFTVYLNAQAAGQTSRLARRLCRNHGLTSKPILEERLHVSLHFLGHYHRFPRAVVRTARKAAATITLPPFDVTFDRVVSLDDRPFNRPLVLFSRSRNHELDTLRRVLGAALMHKGLAHAANEYWEPHVTLLYDDHCVADHAVEEIRWTVESFELVYSLVGQTIHERLARWSLNA